MKRLVFVLIVNFFCASLVYAQSETQSFDVDGVKVIFKPTSKDIVNVRIYFIGGVTNYPASKAGIENIALDATVKCGAGGYSPDAFKDTLDKYGILMYGNSTYDYGYIQVNCISRYLNQAWDLFSRAVMNPNFDAGEVNLLKNEKIAFNRDYESDPDNRLGELQIQNAFSNTPYATNPKGTKESLASITVEDLASYYKSILNKNKIFIVAVGKISKQELYEKILSSFGNLPSLPYTPAILQTPILKDNKLISESTSLSTNYVGAIMNAPEYTNIYYVPFRLGMSGISGNLYRDLRSNLNLSYAPGANTVALKMPYAMMHAGTSNPQAVMFHMMDILKNVLNNGLSEEWLQHIKNTYITSSYISDQSASAITNSLGTAEILGGWQYADDLPKLVQMATVEQVNMALNSYIVGLRWSYLGKTDDMEGFKPPVY